MAANRLGVVIVDDHALYRGGIRAALEHEPELLVLGETAGGEAAIEKIAQVRPDIIVVGINPPALAGLEVGRNLRRRLPRTLLVALASHPDDAGRLEARDAGFDRYIGKTVTAEAFVALVREGVAAIRTTGAAEPHLRALPTRKQAAVKSGLNGAPPLSRRETEILHLVAEGQSNKEIAAVLGISDQTVKNNITSMLRKLDVQDRTQAVIHALRHGWIQIPPIMQEVG